MNYMQRDHAIWLQSIGSYNALQLLEHSNHITNTFGGIKVVICWTTLSYIG